MRVNRTIEAIAHQEVLEFSKKDILSSAIAFNETA